MSVSNKYLNEFGNGLPYATNCDETKQILVILCQRAILLIRGTYGLYINRASRMVRLVLLNGDAMMKRWGLPNADVDAALWTFVRNKTGNESLIALARDLQKPWYRQRYSFVVRRNVPFGCKGNICNAIIIERRRK